jgi:MerR family transcriptional regulator/heat shock protein HspR
MNENTRAIYVISVAAQLAGVHPQTLRNYERSGLLDPSRTSGGSRRFSNEDLTRLRRIQELTEAGCNLEGVRRILQLEAELARTREQVAELQREVQTVAAETTKQFRRDLVPVQNTMAIFVNRINPRR